MGWEVNDEIENDSGVMELKETMAEIIDSHNDMKKEVKKQSDEVKELKKQIQSSLGYLKS